jgi:membrane-associated protein
MVSAPEPAATPSEADDAAEAEPVAGIAPAAGDPAPSGGGKGGNYPPGPWIGKPGKADIVCWVGITLSGLYYLALLPFRAALVGTHPVLMVILNGSTEAIVSAAAFARIGHGTMLVVMLACIPGLMKFDLLFWWGGRLWGERVIELMYGRNKRGRRYTERARRWGRKFTWPAVVVCPFLPIPNAIIYIIAGWTGMSLVTFLILDFIGSMMWAGMLAGLGYELGHHAVVVAQTVSRYGLWFTLALVALIIVSQIRRVRAIRSAAPG